MLKKLQLLALLLFVANANAQSWINVGTPGFSAINSYFPSIAIDSAGTPYTCGIDDTGNVWVMKYDGTTWVNIGNAGRSNNQDGNNTIAIDRHGVPYVAFQDYDNSLKISVMKYNGTSWVQVGSPGFSAGVAINISIVFDTSGMPYVAYEDSTFSYKALVMKYNDTAWVSIGAPGSINGVVRGGSNSLIFSPDNIPYLAISDLAYSFRMSVLKFNGLTWEYVGTPGFSIDEALWPPSMTIDDTGNIYVVYQAFDYNNIVIALKYSGGIWSSLSSWVGDPVPERAPTIVIDSSGDPIVAYIDSASCRMITKKWLGGRWVSLGTFTGISTGCPEVPQLTKNRNGTPYIAYSDEADNWAAVVMKLDPNTITLCTGDTTQLSDTVTSGVWLISDTTVATVDMHNGQVIAVGAGSATISYTAFAAASATTIIVNPNPSPISGYSLICPLYHFPFAFHDATTGGIWSSSNTSVATVNDTGLVYPVSHTLFQTTDISYSVSGCSAHFTTMIYCEGAVNGVAEVPPSLSVSPNPTTGIFTILLSAPANETAPITITSILGEPVKRFDLSTNKETAMQLNAPPGIYFIRATTSTGMLTNKIMVR